MQIDAGWAWQGLTNPGSAGLSEIIAAIESKYGTSISHYQFNIMKNVCDALNNLDICDHG